MSENSPYNPELPPFEPYDLDSWTRQDLINLIICDAEKIHQNLPENNPGLIFTHIPQDESWAGYVIALRSATGKEEGAPTISLTKVSRIKTPYEIVEQKEVYVDPYLQSLYDLVKFAPDFDDIELRAIATVLSNDTEQRPQLTDKELLQPYWDRILDDMNMVPRSAEKRPESLDCDEDGQDFISKKTTDLAFELLCDEGDNDEYGSHVALWLNTGGLYYVAEVCGSVANKIEAIHLAACLDDGEALDQVEINFNHGKMLLPVEPSRPILWTKDIIQELFEHGTITTREYVEPILYS